MNSKSSTPSRLIRFPEVKDRTGLGRSVIYKYIEEGNFPKPIKIGKRAVAWLSTDIDTWIAQQVAKAMGNRTAK